MPVQAPLPVAVLDRRQRVACLRLIRSENVGPVTFRELINHFGGAEAALDALPEMSRRGGGRAVRIASREAAEDELAAAAKIGAEPIFTIEPGYPAALAHIAVPPPMLYVVGRLELLQRPAVAIVGARNGSAAGIKLTRMFAARLGAEGYLVVSGLARGIDGAAHEAALATGTVAVLAGGPDFIYPPEHADLHQRIAEQGCLVSEMPPGFKPRGQDFPRRNRIISGIALAVLVVEAARRSGSLITARMAAEQGREVMAVPGHPLDPRAEGTNGLIKHDGATMVTSPEDVVEILAPMRPVPRSELSEASVAPPMPRVPPSPAHRADGPVLSDIERVLGVLSAAPVDIDEIVRATSLPVQAVRVSLLELALAGRIEQHGGQLVSLTGPPT